jgi:hypothetical protein
MGFNFTQQKQYYKPLPHLDFGITHLEQPLGNQSPKQPGGSKDKNSLYLDSCRFKESVKHLFLALKSQ